MTDPYAYSEGKREHSLLAERALGRKLPAGAVVHHIDGDGKNNARGNLVICPDQKYHALLHRRTEMLDTYGDGNLRRCKFCWTSVDPRLPEAGFARPRRGDEEVFHRACVNRYNYIRRHGIEAYQRWAAGKLR